MYTIQDAEAMVYDMLDSAGINTELISDTVTVENLLDEGYTLTMIAEGMVNRQQLLDNIAWLD